MFITFFFCIHTVLVAISPFSLLILLIWILSHFFLGESGQRFVSFVYHFKESVLDLLISSFVFFNLYFIYSLLNLYYFLSSSDLGFVGSPFSNSFRWWVRLFDFFFLFDEGMYHYEFPHKNCFL